MNMPLQVTHVVENLNRGGLERMVVDLAALQHAQGIQTRVVALYQPGELADELRAQGVPVVACGKQHGKRVRPLLRMWQELSQWPAPGVIHSHNAMAHLYAAAVCSALPRRCLLNTRHGMGKSPHARLERLYRLSMSRTRHVVTVCDEARRQLQAWQLRPRGGMSCIHNGISLRRLQRDRGQARAALERLSGLPAGATVIGTVGRLEPVKRHDLLIDAFRRLRDACPQEDLHLVIIGDGSLRQPLQAQVDAGPDRDRIHLAGARGDVGTLLAGLDLFAMSSDSEGYSLALVEAAAAGLAIVATDVGGNREIVDAAGCGQLVAPGDPQAFAQALDALLRQPQRLQACSRAASAWALREASIEAMAARYQELYLRLLGAHDAATDGCVARVSG